MLSAFNFSFGRDSTVDEAAADVDRQVSNFSQLPVEDPAWSTTSAEVEAERLWWAEASERQVGELSQAVKDEQQKCFNAVDELRAHIEMELRQELTSVAEEFAAQLSSVEQRLRREQQASHEAALEATAAVSRRPRLHEAPALAADEVQALRVLLQARPCERLQELTAIAEELATRASTAEQNLEHGRIHEADASGPSGSPRFGKDVEPAVADGPSHVDSLIEEIGLRVDGLNVKLEDQLVNALADERKARGKALSDIFQYIEHMTNLLENDANVEMQQVQAAISALASRVKVLEEAEVHNMWRLEHGNSAAESAGAGFTFNDITRPSMRTAPGLPVHVQPQQLPREVATGETSPPHLFVFEQDGRQAQGLGGATPSASSADCSMLPTAGVEPMTQHVRQHHGTTNNNLALPEFSEDMKESLKHIVRKVGDALTKDTPEPQTCPLGPNTLPQPCALHAQKNATVRRSPLSEGSSLAHVKVVSLPPSVNVASGHLPPQSIGTSLDRRLRPATAPQLTSKPF